jgi:hypothetical protein
MSKRKRDEDKPDISAFLNSKNFTPEQLKQLKMMPNLPKEPTTKDEIQPKQQQKEEPPKKKPKPNTNFLKNLLKNTVDFNQRKINDDLEKSKKVLSEKKFTEKPKSIQEDPFESKNKDEEMDQPASTEEEAISFLNSILGKKQK